MNPVLSEALINALVTIGTLAISTLSVYAILYIKRLKRKAEIEIDKLEDEDSRKYAQNILNKVENALIIAVDKMESTLVKELKVSTEDGKLTKEDQERVAKEAKKLADKILGEDTAKLLDGIVGDTAKYIDAKIASLVIDRKNGIIANNMNDNYTLNS